MLMKVSRLIVLFVSTFICYSAIAQRIVFGAEFEVGYFNIDGFKGRSWA